ncbi:hypothetical protein [Sinorhizobium saheli]|uniref:Uncharacterized protein n=1 Tax=Sinorhizobium saheli TaxID=36856 RepID=A0A178YPE7_SINSA|nr:hypothetical protein [Sinorhizobium saheli]MQW86926.1 hypothetical protein [Sinorhizobium saheli]OAP49297.1 hypothetical protein ATB98_24945 [Sinorhizobium saheli]
MNQRLPFGGATFLDPQHGREQVTRSVAEPLGTSTIKVVVTRFVKLSQIPHFGRLWAAFRRADAHDIQVDVAHSGLANFAG